MKTISLQLNKAAQFLAADAIEKLEPQVKAAQDALDNGTCAGNDFLNDIEACAEIFRSECDTVVVAGIGGSYLGARAVIEALGNSLQWLVNNTAKAPNVIFAGNSISEDYLAELTEYLKDKRFGVINISKSGTTTETALTFLLLKKQC